MGRQRDIGSLAIFDRLSDHITGSVDPRALSDGAELREHPLGALLFKESCRGNPAKVRVLIVNPLFFALEPLQRVAQKRRFGGIRGDAGERGGITGGRRGLGAGSQMTV